MSYKTKANKRAHIDKIIDFGRQLFASTLRSRKGALAELAVLSRFQQGTKAFERYYSRLIPLIDQLKKTFQNAVLKSFPKKGLGLGIIDDTSIKKTGKKFPKLQKHHEHANNTFYDGMKVLSSSIYRNGKVAAINSQITGKGDNKLEAAKQEADMLIADFLVDIFLFDSWYCKQPLLEHIQKHNKLFVSRARCNSKAVFDEDNIRLDEMLKNMPHKEYEKVKISKRSYWIKDIIFDFKAYGVLRVIISKESQHDEPIFLVTNAHNFSAKFIVKLYMKRFAIEIFFKDAKQYLNFETFMCRSQQKWELHLHLVNVLHWAIQKKKSISRAVRAIRESIDACLLFINKNQLIQLFFDELRKKCQT